MCLSSKCDSVIIADGFHLPQSHGTAHTRYIKDALILIQKNFSHFMPSTEQLASTKGDNTKEKIPNDNDEVDAVSVRVNMISH